MLSPLYLTRCISIFELCSNSILFRLFLKRNKDRCAHSALHWLLYAARAYLSSGQSPCVAMKQCQWILIECVPHDSCNQASTLFLSLFSFFFFFTVGGRKKGRKCFCKWDFFLTIFPPPSPFLLSQCSRTCWLPFAVWKEEGLGGGGGDDGWKFCVQVQSAWFHKPLLYWRWVESGLWVAFQVSWSAEGSLLFRWDVYVEIHLPHQSNHNLRPQQNWVSHPYVQVLNLFCQCRDILVDSLFIQKTTKKGQGLKKA